MNPSDVEKIALEHQAAKLFMQWYERNTGKKIRHIWHNDPIRPDVSCLLEGEPLDLEIAHLYGDESEAMAILGRELTTKTREALDKLANEPASKRLVKALNRILANKSGKHYQSKRVWLVIRNAHPAWSKEEIKALESFITIPTPHTFEKVWIIGDMQGDTGIVRLYP